jgi:hypothetical protein
MRIMIPPPRPEDFSVGAVVTGVVKNIAEFGLFIDFKYASSGYRWGTDGLLHFFQTPRTDEARAYRHDDRIGAVVTEWNVARQRLRVALPADPTWLTTDVLAMARGISADRAFDRLPILADALQDAGCTDEAVLAHCRFAKVEESWLIPLLVGASG